MSSIRESRFKGSVDATEARRRREESSVQVRKNKREMGLAKRRQAAAEAPTAAATAAAPGAVNTFTAGAGSAPTAKRQYSVADIPQLWQGLQQQDLAVKLEALRGFRRVLSIEPAPPVCEVLATGALNVFVQLLQMNDSPEMQFEAAWALTNVASTEHTNVVVDAGVVPLMSQLLMSHNADVREQCAWCLGNIAGDSAELRDTVLRSGCMAPLLQNVLQPASNSMLRNAVWALSNFCRGKPQPELSLVAEACPVLAGTLMSEDKEVLMDSCWALSYLSDGDDARMAAVVNAGIVPRLVQLLGHESAQVVTPALRTVGNIVSGADQLTQAVLDAGVLDRVGGLLAHIKKGVRKEACWMLSNIAAGSKVQIGTLLDHRPVIDAVLHHIEGAEWDVRKEAAWVVSNIATGGNAQQVHRLLTQHDTVKPVCGLLKVQDARVTMVALDALEALLKVGEANKGAVNVALMVDECDGIDSLEALQQHENEQVYQKAVALIEHYFGEDAHTDENMAPAATGSSFTFGVAPPPAPAMDKAAQGAIIPAPATAQQPFAPAFNFNLAS